MINCHSHRYDLLLSVNPALNSFSGYSNDEEESMPTKKFVITFSANEWQQIKPQETI